MAEETDSIILNTDELMQKAQTHLASELMKIRAGKANPQILDGIMVDYYGASTLLNQVANVSVTDSRTISVQPWEKSMIQPIERALLMANIGITPQNDGQIIRLFLPPLTEERRKDLVKKVNAEGENGKISIRNIRREAIEQVKKQQKDGLSEDATKDAETEIQTLTDKNISLIEHHCKEKEKEIMTI